MKHFKQFFSSRQWIAAAATTGVLFLAGCSGSFESVSSPNDIAAAGIGGVVHGGNNPVYGATVKLYEAGYTGYGSAGTLLATTSTSSVGGFQFTKNAGTGTPGSGTTSSYQCDSAHPSAIIYIIANGGNTTGSGSTTPANTAAAFLAVVGNCNTIATSTVIELNELNTAATVYAFAQYINPGTTTPGTESIGTNNTTQAILGLNNALSTFANMASNSSETSTTIAAPTYTGTNASVNGVTVTATSNSAKLVTIANILSSCVNNTSSAASQCVDLFADATPPTNTTTSQPTASFPVAHDTIQAAYYLATNPGLNGGSTTCTTTPADTTAASCLFSLATGTGAPFQSNLGAAPTDYTLGITYTATGTCTGGGSLISGPYHGNIDASGNLWIVNATATSANLSEISPSGMPLYCGGALNGGRGIAIDANGNVWAAFNGTTTNGIVELPYGTTTLNTMSIGTSAPYTMAADGFGNVFMNVNSGESVYEWIDSGSGTPPTPVKIVTGMENGSTAAGTLAYVAMDSQGRLWDTSDSAVYMFGVYPNTSTSTAITGFSVSGGTVTFNGTNSFATGNQVQITNLTSSEGSTFNLQTFTLTAATATTFSAATTAANTSGTVTDSGGALLAGSYLYGSSATTSAANTYGIAVDNNNVLYQGTTCCSTGAPYRSLVKWTVGSNGTATPTLSATNPGGINGVRSVAVDGAGNLWVGNEYPSSTGATASTGQYAVMEFTTASFTPLSPPGTAPATCTTGAGCATGGGFYDSNIQTPYDLDIDPTGNLWILNTYLYAVTTTYGSSVTELVGAAVPVATPLAVATGSNKLGAKP